jgi:crotonobetainyl-CoA:carnitine CoA-transferase CaiB-like acyl-CoA transferase
LRLEDVLEHPQIAANDLMVDVEVAGHGRARVVGNPIRLSRSPAAVRRPVPRLGQHTREVLAEAGYSPSEIDRLNSDRAVRLHQVDPHQYAALFV